jgi:hypothetical protein
MNFDPGSLLASLVVSSVGWVLFSYGRKQQRLPHVAIGMLMMVYPYFLSSVGWQLGMLPVLLGVLWLLTRLGM